MTDPHAAEPAEDPEAHIGQEMPDPWDETYVGTAPIPDPPLLQEARAEAPDWPLWFGGAGGGR